MPADTARRTRRHMSRRAMHALRAWRIRPLAAAACLALGSLATGPTQSATVSWLAGSSFWDLASSWDLGVPGPADDAALGIFDSIFRSGTTTLRSFAGTGQLTVQGGELAYSAASSIGSLTLSAGVLRGTADLGVAGGASFSGGTLAGAGTLRIDGAASLSNFTVLGIDEGRTLALAGGATFNNNSIRLNPSNTNSAAAGQLRNLAGSTITDGGASGSSISASVFNATDNGASAQFTNAGTYRKQGAGNSSIGVQLVNSGLLDVQGGQMDLGAGSSHTGSLATAVGATLVFSNGNHSVGNAANIDNRGTLRLVNGTLTLAGDLNATGLLSLTGGVLDHGAGNHTVGSFHMGGGSLTGAGSVTVTGASTFSSGSLLGTGSVRLNGLASLGNFIALGIDEGRTLTVAAGASLSNNTIQLNPGGTGNAAAGRLVNLAGSTITDNSSSGTHISANSRGTVDNGASALFSNAGTYRKLGAGSSSISAPFANTGMLDIQAGSLELSGSSTHTGATLTGAGSLLFSGGTHALDAATTVAVGHLSFSGGTVQLAGSLNVSGTTTFSGGVVTLPAVITSLGSALAISNGIADLGANNLALPALTMTSGSLSGTGTLMAASASFSGGTLLGTGTLQIDGVATFTNFSTLGIDDGRTLAFGGGATLSNTSFALNPTGTGNAAAGRLVNLAGSTITDNSSSGVSISASNRGTVDNGASAGFTNAGTYRKLGAGSTSITAPVSNSGLLLVEAGTVELSGTSSHTGSLATAAGGTLLFSNGVHTASNAANIDNQGVLRVSGGSLTLGGNLNAPGLLSLSGGTIDLGAGSHTVGSFSMGGGVLSGSGDVVVSGSAAFTGGTLLGTGTLRVNAAASLSNFSVLSIDEGRTLGLAGGATLSNTSILLNPTGTGNPAAGRLLNLAGSILTDNSSSGSTISASNRGTIDNGASALFTNAGTYRKLGGGTSAINAPLVNTGLLEVQAGTLSLGADSTHSGSLATAAGATLAFTSGTHQVGNATNIDNQGTLQVAGGTLTLAGTMATAGLLSVTGGTLDHGAGSHTVGSYAMGGGTLTGNGRLRVSGAASFTGGTLLGTGTLQIDGLASFSNFSGINIDDGRTLSLAGGASLTNTAIRLNPAGTDNPAAGRLVNLAGSTITDNSGSGSSVASAIRGGADNGASALFTNAGTYRKLGAGTSTIGAALANTGTLEVQAGSLDITGPLANLAGTTLTGGRFVVTGPGSLRVTGGNVVTNAADLVLDGAGAAFLNGSTGAPALANFAANAAAGRFTIQNGRNFTSAASFNNSGVVTVGNASTFTAGGSVFTNNAGGMLQLAGGTLTGAALTNAGDLAGFGAVQPAVSNTGLLRADGGRLALLAGVQGSTGTLEVAANATLSLAASALDSSAVTVRLNGNLDLGAQSLQVFSDYDNAAFGNGNSFNARANVNGAGSLVGVGVAMALTGAQVSTTGPGTATLNLGTVRGGTSVTRSFQVANTGSGASLRGALQTTGGVGITDGRLSGNGLVDGNLGPVAAGQSTAAYSVTLAATGGGGALSGQRLRVVSNFDNVLAQTLQLSGFTTVLAQGAATPAGPVDLGNFRIGGTPALRSANLDIGNLTTGDGAERLALLSASTLGNFSARSLLVGSLVTPGAAVTGAEVSTAGAVAGVNTGSVTLQFGSNGQAFDTGFTTQATNQQSVDLVARGYLVAQPSLPTSVALGNFRVTDGASRSLLLTNTAVAPAGFQEALNAAPGATTTGVTLTGVVTGLAAGASSSNLTVGLATGGAGGARSGTATVNLVSNGAGSSGLGLFDLPAAPVTVTGTAFNLAAASVLPATPLTVANQRVGDAARTALTITNTGTAGLYTEALNARIAGLTGAATAFGTSFNDLAAGASNNLALGVGIDTSTAGARSGTVTLAFQSDGTGANGRSGLAAIDLARQSLTIRGNVYRLASAGPVAPGAVVFSNQRVGGTASQALSLSNTAAADSFSERLNANIAGTGSIVTAGSVGLLGAGASSNVLTVRVDTGTAGAKRGVATITLASDGTGTSGFAAADLGTQTVNVSGNVYRLATASALAPAPVTLAAQRVGGTANQALSLTNTAAADGFSERLNAVIAGSGAALVGGSVSGLTAGGSSTALTVAVDTATAGAKSGVATVTLASDGTGTSGFGALGIGTQTVNVSGNVYAPAVARLDTPVIDFGTVRVGDVVAARTVQVTNTATGGLTDVLVAGLSGGGAPFTASGSGQAAAGAAVDGLSVQLDTATAGVFNDSATLALASRNAEMADLDLGNVAVTLLGQVNNLAVASLGLTAGSGSFSATAAGWRLDFGTLLQGSGPFAATLGLANSATGPADALTGSFDLSGLGGPFSASGFGPFSGLAAGSTLADLGVQFDTAAVGSFSQVIVLTAASTNGSGPDLALPSFSLELTGTVAAVPEPGTYALMLGGLALVAVLARRRRTA